MTTEERRFYRLLRLRPNDRALRLTYAYWLESRGDWRATGYRWMVEHGKWPFDWASCREISGYLTFDWYSGDGAIWDVPESCTLPEPVWHSLDPLHIDTQSWSAYGTAREAEEALCQVIYCRRGRDAPAWGTARARRDRSGRRGA